MPGAVVFSGEVPTHHVRLALITYDADTFHERVVADLEDAFGVLGAAPTAWLDLDGVHEVRLVQRVGERLGISALILEDIVNLGQRPKMEEFEGFIHLTLKMIRYQEGLHLEQISLLVGPGYVISFQEHPGDVFEPVRERLRTATGRIRSRGATYLAYALLDVVIDHYYVALEAISNAIEDLEHEVMDDPGPDVPSRIRTLYRDLVIIRKAVWPVREMLARLERSESPLIPEDMRPFLRDVYDHGVQVLDIVESMRDVLAGVRDAYDTALSNRMNEVMKVLTIVGTIFIPLTFIAGIYGMNFSHIPELQHPYGYPIAMATMALIAVALIVYFRRKDWL